MRWVVLTVLTAGCDFLSDPEPQLRLDLTADARPAELVVVDNDVRVRCTVDFVATPIGSREVSGMWRDATFHFSAGFDRRVPFDSLVISEAEVHQAWTTAFISGTSQSKSNWSFYAGAPFTLRADFRYNTQGDTRIRVASQTFECGPTPTVASAPAPYIASYTASPTGALRPRSVMVASVTASSPIGILWIRFVLTGVVRQDRYFLYDFATEATQHLQFEIPASVAPGSSVLISVIVADVAGQTTSQVVRMGG